MDRGSPNEAARADAAVRAEDAERAWLAAFAVTDPPARDLPPFAPATLKGALDGALALARAAGALPAAFPVLADLEARLGAVARRVGYDRRTGLVAGRAPTAVSALVRRRDGRLAAAGRWVPDVVALAGGRAVLVESGAPDRPVAPEEVDAAGPALVVLASGDLAAVPEVAALGAVRDGRVLVLPALFTPGPALADAAERLLGAIHPATALPGATLGGRGGE